MTVKAETHPLTLGARFDEAVKFALTLHNKQVLEEVPLAEAKDAARNLGTSWPHD